MRGDCFFNELSVELVPHILNQLRLTSELIKISQLFYRKAHDEEVERHGDRGHDDL